MPKYMVRISDLCVLKTNSKLKALFEMAKLYFTSEWFDTMMLVEDGKYVLIEIDGNLKK